MTSANLRLKFDGKALVQNWQALNALSGSRASCGAAVKANAYGLGVTEVVARLIKAGCQDFFVATWQEAGEIAPLTRDCSVTVLNGVLEHEMPLASKLNAKPMINSAEQLARWRNTGRPCDVMINTGMNRLGIDCTDASVMDWTGVDVDVLASHLASADEDVPQNAAQLAAFGGILAAVPHLRKSLANSAAIALGEDYLFDLTRPGLALYGGVPRAELAASIAPVGALETRLLQVRHVESGDQLGYNATFTAAGPMKIGIAALGYADGYLRGFSGTGRFQSEGQTLPVLGRVSMDLIALDLAAAPDLGEGDWVNCTLDLPVMSDQSGLSQYEIITSLGSRYDRKWTD